MTWWWWVFQEGYGVSWVAEYSVSITLALLASSLCLLTLRLSREALHKFPSGLFTCKAAQCPLSSPPAELTVDWLVALHSSPLIVLKWSCSLRPKIHFPWARERREGERRGKTERLNSLKWDEDRWKKWRREQGTGWKETKVNETSF